MKARNFLTKSTFKIGLECPRKLFYLNKPEEYSNNAEEDPFLQALARGGYQIGALAKLKFPKGIEVLCKDHTSSLKKTAELLNGDSVIIFEGAFTYNSSFIRSDIVVKNGQKLKVIEVKSKSFDPDDIDIEFLSPRDSKPNSPKIRSEWASYLYDLAFQVWVVRNAYPQLEVSAAFMGVDKNAVATESDLHQMFLVKQNGKEKEVVLTRSASSDFKGHQLLKEVDLTEIVDHIILGNEKSEFFVSGNIVSKANVIGQTFLKDVRYPVKELVGAHCKKCQFKGKPTALRSGFDECWVEASNIEAASSKRFAFDLWNFRGTDKVFQSNRYLLEDLIEDDLGEGKSAERQLIQLAKHKNHDLSPWFDLDGLKSEISSWKYPLHFIDFETCMPAIPFQKGMAPYSEIAFQFSHHTIDKAGQVKHVGQFINLQPGYYPTFDFVRNLKQQLEKDEGTVFRYSSHENSVLNRAIFQLQQSTEKDKTELIDFIKSITSKKMDKKSKDQFLWRGQRNMIDLLEIIKMYYYSPLTGGSNSLKFVLPAILAESSFLKTKYTQPIYGTDVLTSLNFSNHKWVNVENGLVSDPYKQLPKVFSDEDLEKIDGLLSEDDAIRNGGAAMMAYCKAQYTEMSEPERAALESALLKYCELDTLAMVMLVEYWFDVIK